jgi:cation diffusion facilitator family transporter
MSKRMQGHDRVRAGWVSLGVGIAVFGGKVGATFLTGSAAVFSDATESTVNIVAAGLLVFALSLAARPPDPDHPYGHGKVEFFSAGIEGAFILVAALLIVVQAVRDLIVGPELHQIEAGMAILLACSLVNTALGIYLVRAGRRFDSLALEADGRHVLTDVWTTGGVILGLWLAGATGWVLLDPLVAIAVALNVFREGFALMRRAVRGLMDEADPGQLASAAQRLEELRHDSWIDVHSLRAWRSGARHHLDLHMTVPRYYDVEQLHAIHDRIETSLLSGDREGDVVVHFDPCTVEHCRSCAIASCPMRSHAFERRPAIDLPRATRSDDAVHSGSSRPPARVLHDQEGPETQVPDPSSSLTAEN